MRRMRKINLARVARGQAIPCDTAYVLSPRRPRLNWVPLIVLAAAAVLARYLMLGAG